MYLRWNRDHFLFTGVGLERLIGCKVAWDRGVGAQRHCGGRRGWAKESVQICRGVRNPSTLVPAYQGDTLYILVIDILYNSEKIPYFQRF